MTVTTDRRRFVTDDAPHTHCACCGRALFDVVSVRLGVGPVCRANGASPADARDLFSIRSDYTVEISGDAILVVDLDRGGRSVTNDAEGVIQDMSRAGLLRPGMRVIYRDSRRVWDQMLIRDGEFVGFAPLGASTRETALAAIAAVQAGPLPAMA